MTIDDLAALRAWTDGVFERTGLRPEVQVTVTAPVFTRLVEKLPWFVEPVAGLGAPAALTVRGVTVVKGSP